MICSDTLEQREKALARLEPMQQRVSTTTPLTYFSSLTSPTRGIMISGTIFQSMTFGFSRDDAGKFLDAYYDRKIYENDPFAKLDQTGVGRLVEVSRPGRRGAPGAGNQN